MSTRVKPSRINITGTPQAGEVPVYVNEDCFCWGQNGVGDVTGPASSTDGNVAVFDGCTGKAIKDSGKSISCLAQLCDIPTDNCELANGCGYTTCTGTLVPSDLNCYAKCCDIPTDNCQLSNGCNYLKSCDLPDLSGYQLKCNMVCNLTGADNNHYPTAKAVVDAMSCLGGGDMLKATYDPCNCSDDAFDYNNFYNTPNMCCYAQICDVPTDNCQLANGCCYADCDYVNNSINSVTAYYITKNAQGDQFATYAELAAATTFYSGGQARIPTRNDYTIVLADENHDNATTRYIYNSGWEYQYTVNETALTQQQLDALNSGITCSKVNCYDNCLAQCCDIPTNNCQLSNGCGYITGINCNDVTTALGYTPAQCCDIPTDNCQLGNSCGFIKGITCSDVTNALGYTPYSNANPNGYTSCTGTLKACDLCGYAQCCDIPTDNCQLANGCGYTTCTGTLQASDIACINGCCLTNGGDICIQGGGGGGGTKIDLLIVGGGGGGGGGCGNAGGFGGGGGEAIEYKQEYINPDCSYSIEIGQGGAGGCCWTGGCDGGDTTICTGGSLLYKARGGHGAVCTQQGYGSSGYAYMTNKNYGPKGASGNGIYGGFSACTSQMMVGGGGGGSAGMGTIANDLNNTMCKLGGVGGPGISSTISGENCGYGGGGGGGAGQSYVLGFGGYGGGGDGNKSGCANTGGGGGGGKGGVNCGGCGGSGVVIIRYTTDGSMGINCATGGTIYCCRGYTIHCFTANGTFTIVS